MPAYLLTLLYSLACGIAVFDAVLKGLPEPQRFIIFFSQLCLAGGCGTIVFVMAFMIVITFYVILKEAVRKVVERKKDGNQVQTR